MYINKVSGFSNSTRYQILTKNINSILFFTQNNVTSLFYYYHHYKIGLFVKIIESILSPIQILIFNYIVKDTSGPSGPKNNQNSIN